MTTVSHLAEAGEDELVRLLGKAHGAALYRMALGHDDRPVVSDRDAKSVSVEDTFDVDLHDRVRVRAEVVRLAGRCVERLRDAGRSGRTVVLKVRRYDFSTLTRSETLRGPTDDPEVVREAAGRLLEAVDTTGGVRLLGVGVSGLADFTQEDLFAQAATERAATERAATERAAVLELAAEEAVPGPAAPPEPLVDEPPPGTGRRWLAGHDVRHDEYGAGWVQGSGVGRVTVRFEDPYATEPGRVRTFRVDDPALQPSDPLPLVRAAATAPGGPDSPAVGEEADTGERQPGRPGEAAAAGAEPEAQARSSSPASRPKSRSGGGGVGAEIPSP